MSNTDRAKIYTFYSYKGGVGRSMALANIAELLYRNGLRVLMIDFDLEAPGLEQYFYESDNVELHKLLCKRGMIDLLFSYKSLRTLSDPKQLPQTSTELSQETSTSSEVSGAPDGSNFPYAVEPLSNFVHDIYPAHPNRPGMLSIMTAGRRAKKELTPESEAKKPKDEFALYADRVRSFAWDDFYLNFDGELFFEWFREEAIKNVDIVLIDSRTGVAEMSGVCTYQLADVVAMFVAANHQNVEGIKKVAESLTSNELIKEGRKGRELSLIFVPSRVDLTGEKHKLDDLAVRFRQVADKLISPTLRFVTDSFVDLKIPYISYYSFVEEIAVRDSKSPAAIEMTKAYEKICRSFAQLDPKVEAKLRVESEFADSDNLAEQQNRNAEQVFDQLELKEQIFVPGLFTRMVRVAQMEEGERKDSARNVKVAELSVPEIEVADKFAAAGLLVFSNDKYGNKTVALAAETLIDSWSRLEEWISEDRDFLLWRQKLQSWISDWEDGARDAALLLPKAKSLEAEKWHRLRRSDLNLTESLYISTSLNRRRRERWTKYAALSIGGLALFVLLYILWIQKTATTPEETRSRQLASNSEAVLSYLPEQSLLLAVEAVRVSPTVEAQQTLRKVLQQSRLRTVIRVGGTAYSAQFSHDGRRIVTGSGDSYQVAQIWEPGNVNRWQNLLILDGHEGDVRAAAFSPDDKLVATASYDGTTILWDSVTGRMIGQRAPVTHQSLSDLAWSPDGKLMAAASLANNQVYVWDVPGQKLVKTLVGFTDNVNTVSFSTNGNFLAAGSKDNRVLVWDVATWKEAAPPLLGHTNEVLSVRFSPDGKFLVTTGGENTARVWSTSDWRTVTVFSEHSARINRASFNPDGKLIVTASADNSAKIWETLTGKLIAELRGSLGAVNDASFSPDGKLILTASDFTARLWDLNPEIDLNGSVAELSSLACTRVTRNLTESEWLQYMGNETYRATCPNIPLPQLTPTPQESPTPKPTPTRPVATS